MTHPYTRLFLLPSPPSTDDDITAGYEVGDVIVAGGAFYDCSDNTEAAAVWQERGGGGLTEEEIQDMIATFIEGSGGISTTYSDSSNKLYIVGDALRDRLDKLDTGWTALYSETMTRITDNQFTLATDKTAVLKKGAKIRWNDGSTKYGVVESDSVFGGGVTTVDLVPNTTYVLAANSTFLHLSFDELPVGWPDVAEFKEAIGEHHTHPAGSGIPLDGWEAVSATWTRTGNHTFTVSGDVTGTYRKGAKVKYSDGTVDYGVIGSSSHAGGTTTVNLIPNTDFLMAAATITGTYISYIENPEGWPGLFTWAPTYSAGGSMTYTSVTTSYAKWRVGGKILYFGLDAEGTTGGTAANSIIASLPISAAFSGILPCSGNTRDATSGATLLGRGLINSPTDGVSIGKPDGSNYGLGTGRLFRVEGFYEF